MSEQQRFNESPESGAIGTTYRISLKCAEDGTERMPTAGNLLLDTDVVVDFLRGLEPAVTFLHDNAERIHLSVVVVAEIYAGARKTEIEDIRSFVAAFPSIAISTAIAAAGGNLKRQYGSSHGLGLADALIAASAIEHGLRPATLNVKHFPMFPDLEPAYRK